MAEVQTFKIPSNLTVTFLKRETFLPQILLKLKTKKPARSLIISIEDLKQLLDIGYDVDVHVSIGSYLEVEPVRNTKTYVRRQKRKWSRLCLTGAATSYEKFVLTRISFRWLQLYMKTLEHAAEKILQGADSEPEDSLLIK